MSAKTIIAATLAVASLAACASAPVNPDVPPDQALLLSDRLTVIFMNGVQCRVENVAQHLSGELEGCPVPAHYEIRMQQPGHFGNGVAEPYADIIITQPSGRRTLIKKPDSRNWTGRDW
ncbi:MAG: hypothetical protein ACK5LJ_09030 [Paracoccus sp. (in: a-proteobacteria)]